jgi:UDP-glucose 4-epimerase
MQGVISVFLNKIFNKESIEIWGDGKITRDYIYIDDLIDGIYRAFLCKENYSIFNLGSGIGYSINDVLRAIRKVVNHDVKVYYKNQRPCDVHKIYLDIDSAKNKLQWNPTTSLEDGIRATWDFICNSNNTGISNVHQ